ncbi:MAG: NAD-dependent dihydropyrimidine dehydrogenase subunit PreA [Deltaproteobacteria bacterium]|nr:NAD-dependent dihydropyrimidine dehydrogenase subunit PreA [Deltaproteobacteria bacterium]
MDLRAHYLGITLESPFILASAPPTANGDMIRRAFEAGWAGAVTKTLTREPMKNLHNRFAVSRMGGKIFGFENLELLSELPPDAWFKTIAELKAEFPHKAIVGSIMGDARSPDDWLFLARGCQEAGADLLELNFSCPHGCPETGKGAAIGQNAEFSALITGWVKKCPDIRIPVIPKLTAAVTDIRSIGAAVARAGADGICAINTIPSLFGIDLKTLRPLPDIGGTTSYGGYSGPGIKPIALRAVSELQRDPGLPVMACGGISNGFDAAEFLLLGAPVVQVCTEVMLKGFRVIDGMQHELREFMGWHGFEELTDFLGTCRDSVTSFGALDADCRVMPRIDSERCLRCGACVLSCRDGGYQALAHGDNGIALKPSVCSGCSLCVQVCPKGAVRMERV